MSLKIIRNDVTKMHADAIVNAANTRLERGGGVCGEIFSAAGAEELTLACHALGSCPVGGAVMTPAFRLRAKYIIHSPGPVWIDGEHGEAELIRSCYRSALNLALENGCKSIAFPLISSGIYGCPKDIALRAATQAINEFLLENEMQVYLVIFDGESVMIGEQLFCAIERFIDDHYVDAYPHTRRNELKGRSCAHVQQARDENESLSEFDEETTAAPMAFRYVGETTPASEDVVLSAPSPGRSLDEVLLKIGESFSESLLRLIDEKGMTDVQVYKRANIDRKLFSKIRSDSLYRPRKTTALAFAVALKLSLDETIDLLARAGYTLSDSSKFDLIVKFFILEGLFDVNAINEALFSYDQSLLGA